MFYEIMHRESCVAQLSTTGECRVCLEDFMPYDLVLVESDDFDERMMNILDYLVGNTDRHWENWGLLVDNETNQPIRLHDLMDFNRSFQQYDTPEGANCLTVGKRHLSQKDAAVEAVRNIGLNQVRQVEHAVFSGHPAWKATFEERLRVLRNAM